MPPPGPKKRMADDPFDRASAPHDPGMLQRMSKGPGPQMRDRSSDFIENQTQSRPSAVKGRRKCTVCGRLPNSMTEHWGKESASHGPMSTENPDALRNLPGLDQLSKHLGGIFTDRRM